METTNENIAQNNQSVVSVDINSTVAPDNNDTGSSGVENVAPMGPKEPQEQTGIFMHMYWLHASKIKMKSVFDSIQCENTMVCLE